MKKHYVLFGLLAGIAGQSYAMESTEANKISPANTYVNLQNSSCSFTIIDLRIKAAFEDKNGKKAKGSVHLKDLAPRAIAAIDLKGATNKETKKWRVQHPNESPIVANRVDIKNLESVVIKKVQPKKVQIGSEKPVKARSRFKGETFGNNFIFVDNPHEEFKEVNGKKEKRLLAIIEKE